MKSILLAAVALTLVAGTASAGDATWGYDGDNGPGRWAALDSAFALCGQGKSQSPVDLTDFIEAELDPISFDYSGLVKAIGNTGQTVQAEYTSGASIAIGGKVFEFLRIEFHAPSEHRINGDQFPLEAQFVHADLDGNLAILSVLYKQGKANPGLAKLWRQLPAKAGRKVGMAAEVPADQLLPTNREYYRLSGSLTTPPCTEGVLWLVLKDQVTASEAQIDQLTKVLGGANSRPVQPLWGRAILQ